MVRKGNPQQVISRHMHLSLQHTGSGAQPPEGTGDMSPQLLEPPEWSHSKTDKSFCKGSITELCREEKGGEGKEGKREGEGGERGKGREEKKVGTPTFLDESYAPGACHVLTFIL